MWPKLASRKLDSSAVFFVCFFRFCFLELSVFVTYKGRCFLNDNHHHYYRQHLQVDHTSRQFMIAQNLFLYRCKYSKFQGYR